MVKVFGVVVVALTIFIFSQTGKVEAASVLTGDVDLKGYDATITTQDNGETLLTNKKGEYLLDDTSVIYSSKEIKITLDNTEPAKAKSIYVKGNLHFRGNGELNVATDEEIGINVNGYLKQVDQSTELKEIMM